MAIQPPVRHGIGVGQLRRLLIFAVASAALHGLTLAVDVPSGHGTVAPALPPFHGLQAQIVAADGAMPLGDPEPVPDVTVGPQPVAEPPLQEAASHRTGTPDAPHLPGADRWYRAAELDVRAEPLTPVDFVYPPALGTIIGRVKVALFIDERGEVRKAKVLEAEPESLFDDAALSGWRTVRFSPAMRQGVPVKSEKIVQIDFQPELSR